MDSKFKFLPEEETYHKGKLPKPYKRQEIPEYHTEGILAIFEAKAFICITNTTHLNNKHASQALN